MEHNAVVGVPVEELGVTIGLFDAAQHRRALAGEHAVYEASWAGRDYLVHVEPFLDARGAAEGCIGVALDLTERQDAARALQESEARFRTLIENSLDVTLVLEADATVRYASPSAERVLGFPPDELVGRSAFDLVHADDAPALAEIFRLGSGAPGATRTTTYRALHRDGSWRLTEAVGLNMLADPAVRGMVITSRDITARRSLEERLNQSERLEAIGQLAGGIAHDFNNVLLVIRGYASVLRGELTDPQQVADVDEITKATDRAANLTRQLLVFGRRQVLAPRLVSIPDGRARPRVAAAERGLRGHRARARSSTTMRPRSSPTRPRSSRYSSTSSSTRVTRCPRAARSRVGVAACRSTSRTTPRHRRSCPGRTRRSPSPTPAPASRRTSSRTCSSRSSRRRRRGSARASVSPPSTGSSRRAAARSGCAPRREKAPSIIVYLPAAGGEVGEPEDEPTPESALEQGRESVLLVEDEEPVRELVRRVLERAGYRVHAAALPGEALQVLETGEPIDLLLTDVVMPEMSGYQLAALVRRARPEIRTLFISGYAHAAAQAALSVDGDAVLLQKPFAPTELARAVRHVLDGTLPPEAP